MADDSTLTIGDVVTLKSGGHSMTITETSDGNATCEWSVRGDIKSKAFPLICLVKAEPPMTLEQLVLGSMDKRDTPASQ